MTEYIAHNLKELHEALIKSSRGDTVLFYDDGSDRARLESEAFKEVIDKYCQETAQKKEGKPHHTYCSCGKCLK
jgi:site-specific recombinase XerD